MSAREFDRLPRAERIRLCREVQEHLSDLLERTASPELRERVQRLLGDCPGYHAYRNTLEATIRLLRECGRSQLSGPRVTEEDFRRCVEKVRVSLGHNGGGDSGEGPEAE